MGGINILGFGLIEGIVVYTACLIGTVFWLRASTTDVSKGFAIFFMIYSAGMICLYTLATIVVYDGIRRLADSFKT